MSQAATTTITAPEGNQPNEPSGGHITSTPQQENNALITQATPTSQPPPAYSENGEAARGANPILPQPQPVPATAPPEKIQPGLEKRSPITLGELGATPSCVICPRCKWRVITRVEKKAGDHATKMGLVACLLFGVLFFWVPCVMDDCKDSHHYCSNCEYVVAVWEKGAASARVVMTDAKIKAIKENPNALPRKAPAPAPAPVEKKAQWPYQ